MTGKKTPKERTTASGFKFKQAPPDSPIYSRGWTIGSVAGSKRSTTNSRPEGSDKSEDTPNRTEARDTNRTEDRQ